MFGGMAPEQLVQLALFCGINVVSSSAIDDASAPRPRISDLSVWRAVHGSFLP